MVRRHDLFYPVELWPLADCVWSLGCLKRVELLSLICKPLSYSPWSASACPYNRSVPLTCFARLCFRGKDKLGMSLLAVAMQINRDLPYITPSITGGVLSAVARTRACAGWTAHFVDVYALPPDVRSMC